MKYRNEKENIERLLFTKCRPKNGKQKSHIMQTTETLKRQSQKFFASNKGKVTRHHGILAQIEHDQVFFALYSLKVYKL